MNDMENGESRGTGAVSRRSVLRIAGHTAWAAPVIAVATAAPAYAVGSPTGTIGITNQGFSSGLLGIPTKIFGAAKNISNTDAFGTANDNVSILSPVTVTVNVGLGLTVLPTLSQDASGVGGSWAFAPNILQELLGLGTLTLIWTGPTLAPGQQTNQFTLTWLVSLTLGGRTMTPSAQDTFGHNANSVAANYR
jgi:hypothetical protein